VTFQKFEVFVDGSVQSQPAYKRMHRANAAKTNGSEPPYNPPASGTTLYIVMIFNGSRSIRYLVMYVGSFEHDIRLVFVAFSFQTNFKILLVSAADSVVSYIHLECAPY